jgi:hypothetical protein
MWLAPRGTKSPDLCRFRTVGKLDISAKQAYNQRVACACSGRSRSSDRAALLHGSKHASRLPERSAGTCPGAPRADYRQHVNDHGSQRYSIHNPDADRAGRVVDRHPSARRHGRREGRRLCARISGVDGAIHDRCLAEGAPGAMSDALISRSRASFARQSSAGAASLENETQNGAPARAFGCCGIQVAGR